MLIIDTKSLNIFISLVEKSYWHFYDNVFTILFCIQYFSVLEFF